MARKKSKNVRSSKNRNTAVMRVVVILALVGVFLWYLVSKFAKRGIGQSVSSALGLAPDATENIGTSIVPQGVTSVAGVHGFNNPGNITYNAQNDWYGQVGYNVRTIGGNEYKYCNFETLYAGIRALYICAKNVYERLYGIDLAQGVGATDYLTYIESMRGKVGKFYETYSGQSGTASGFTSVFAQMANSVNEPLTALCMAVYKMEAGVNYDAATMSEIAGFQYQRVF